MACRKNAYRAETEMSEYMEAKKEEEAKAMVELEKQLRKTWKPKKILDQCCIQWIAYGSETVSATARGGGGGGMGQPTRGCNGGCGKYHPRITFEYRHDVDPRQTSYGIVSHDLKPFVDWFDFLCKEELATKITTTRGKGKGSSSSSKKSTDDDGATGGGTHYHLVGWLHQHVDNLQQLEPKIIGDHLVKCSSQDIAASYRAYERYMEQRELEGQATKRRKLLNQGSTATAATKSLLESILEICYNYNLQEHLDIVDIAWMRTSCKLFGKYAAKMATSRMHDLRLSYSLHVADPNAQESDNEDDDLDALAAIQAQEAAAAAAAQANVDVNAPVNEDAPDESSSVIHRDNITIKYGFHLYPRQFVREALHAPLVLSEGKYVPDNEENQFLVDWPREGGDGDDNPCRLLVRIHIDGVKQPTNGHIKEYPERDLLFVTPPLEVQRYTFYDLDNYWGMPAPTPIKFTIEEDSRGPPQFLFEDVTFTFRELLGIYARKRFRFEKQKLDEMKTKGRVTLAYKNYVRALAAEARLAPGNERDFNVMEGW